MSDATDPRRQKLDEWQRAKRALPKAAVVSGVSGRAKPPGTISALEQALIDVTSEMSELLVGIESSVARMAATYELHSTPEVTVAADANDAPPAKTAGGQGTSHAPAVPRARQARPELDQQHKAASMAPGEHDGKANPAGTSAARQPMTASARRVAVGAKALPAASAGRGTALATSGINPALRSASASRAKPQAARGSASAALGATPDLDAILARAQRTRQLAACSAAAALAAPATATTALADEVVAERKAPVAEPSNGRDCAAAVVEVSLESAGQVCCGRCAVSG